MKTCTRCGVEKELAEFNKQKAGKDGRRASCRECCRSDNASWRATDEGKACKRAYHESAAGREANKKYTQSEAGKEARHRATRKHAANNPIKKTAHRKVAAAIKSGVLVAAPCEVCCTILDIRAHHDDYSKPLNVRWLCSIHHHEWHQHNDAANG